MDNTFLTLAGLDMTAKHKKKNGLTYLPWSDAWTAIKSLFPDASCDVVKTEEGCIYHTDGKTCWVETSMTIAGETQNEILAVMDHRNQAIPLDQVTSVSANKSIKRCMAKNAALFGLDINLGSGEEISDIVKDQIRQQEESDAAEAEALKAVIKQISAKGSELIAAGIKKDEVRAVVAKYNDGEGNPNLIETMETANAVLNDLNAIVVPEAKPAKKTAAKTAAKKEDA